MTFTQQTPIRRAAITATALASVILASSTAFAASPIVERQMDGDRLEVRIDPSYFKTDEGIADIYAALLLETETACAEPRSGRKAATSALEKKCQTRLLDELVDSTDHQALIQYHRKRLKIKRLNV